VNLNPLGTPKEVSCALSEAVLLANQYPDLKQEELSKHMADLFQIEKEEIVFGNGASELLMAFCHAFLPKKAMVVSPCFSGYEYAVKGASFDCQMVYHPLLEEDGFVLKEDILEHLTEEKPDVFFVTTPNNPTGVLVEKGLLKKIMEICEAQGTVVVLDECFLPLSGFCFFGKRRAVICCALVMGQVQVQTSRPSGPVAVSVRTSLSRQSGGRSMVSRPPSVHGAKSGDVTLNIRCCT
jgi:histidinol-phosphate/aromatic aminotransferase/cobyric acid decarboxylase-like protein